MQIELIIHCMTKTPQISSQNEYGNISFIIQFWFFFRARTLGRLFCCVKKISLNDNANSNDVGS